MLAATWGHLVVGLDFHMVLLPAGPALIPIPHTGVVLDLGGMALGGLINLGMGSSFTAGAVYVNSTPAANCGTGTMGVHPPAIYMAGPPPADAELFFGSSSVYVQGFRAVRCGIDIVMPCSDPVRLPTGVIVPLVGGRPVFIGGMPTPDLSAMAMALAMGLAGRAVRGAARRAFSAGRRVARRAARWGLRAALRGPRSVVRATVTALRATAAASRAAARGIQRTRCFFNRDPVDVATGRVVSTAMDVELPGPIPLRIERSYDASASYRRGALGYGWTHTLEQHVREDAGRITLVDADGREIEVLLYDQPGRRLGPGARMFLPREGLTFEGLEAGGYRVTDKAGIRREFAKLGGTPSTIAKLVRIASTAGHEITLTYRHGQLEWCRDSAGRLVGFEHDREGRLTAIKLPLPSGRGWYVHRRYGYDRAGDLVEVIDEKLAKWRHAYEAHLLVQRTNRLGVSAYWEYDGLGSKARCVRTWVDPRRPGEPGLLDGAFQYAPRRTVMQDSLGRSWAYDKNDVGEVVAVIEPNGATTRYENDPRCGDVAKEIDPLGAIETWEYDGRGNMVRHVDRAGAIDRVEYDAVDRPVRIVDPVGNQLELTYSPLHGRLASRVDPLGERSLFDYTRGVLTGVRTESGSPVLSIEIDARFDIARVTSEPDQHGRVATSTFEYDHLGRAVGQTDARGNVTRIRRDVSGNVVEVSTPSGFVERHRYDAENRIVGSLTARGVERFTWDALGELVQTEHDGARRLFERDTEGQPTAIVNENGERHEYELDVCGRVAREVDLLGVWRRFERDPCGRVTAIVMPQGNRSTYTRDAMGRLLRVEHSDGTFREIEHRVDGLAMRVANEHGEIVYERDAIGRVTRVVDGVAEITSRYDRFGRAEIHSTLGARASFRSDAQGLLAMRVDGGTRPLEMHIERDVVGAEVARVFSTGIDVRWHRDALGRPTERTVSAHDATLDRRRLAWSDAGALDAIVDDLRGGWVQYQRDERSRVVGARDAWGREMARPLDPAGNVLRAHDGSEARLAPGGKVLDHSGGECVYDALGRLAERTLADGSRWVYRWTVEGFLREVERPDGHVVELEYDALGRRTAKRLVRLGPVLGDREVEREIVHERRTVWDGDVPLHEQATGEELTTWYTAPGSFTPAIKQQGTHCLTIATDHLGAPTELHDELGRLAWKAQLDVFGVPTVEVGDRDACPFRWPGQYEDAETGLYYNRFRYYDPRSGRYISPDPIGVLGGAAPYAYPQDPTTECDPLGLIRDGHHTVPVELLNLMSARGWISEDQMRDLRGTTTGTATWREGMWVLNRDTGGNQHHEAHRALSDFFEERYGIHMTNGTQRSHDWEALLERRTTLRQVMNDFDLFYGTWLRDRVRAGHYPQLVGEMPAARRAYHHDQGIIRGC